MDFDAREAAKEAARRDGVTLGAWMNRAIAEHAAEAGLDEQDFDADERLEAVAAQLARLSRQSHDGGVRRPAGRDADWDDIDEPEPAPRRRAPRMVARDTPSPRLTTRATAGRDDVGARGRREVQNPEALLEKAVSAFESRAGRVEARAARALADVAERIESVENERVDMLAQVESRLAGLETHLRKNARSADAEPLRGALNRLEERFESLSRRAPEPQDDETLRKLDRKLSHLLARVERAETAPAAERDEQFSRLEKRFDALLARLDRPTPPRVAAPARRPISREAVAEISARQRALDTVPAYAPAPRAAAPQPVRPAPAPRVDAALEARFDALARKLEAMAERAATPREDHRIDRLQGGIEALSSRIEDMRHEFSAVKNTARSAEGGGVETALRDLAGRVDLLAAAQPAGALREVAGLRGDVAGLARGLSDLAPRGAVAGLENAMRDLSSRVEQARSAVQQAAETRAEPVASPHVEALSRQLADMTRSLQDVAPRGAVAALESAMRELSNRVELAREQMERAAARGEAVVSPDFDEMAGQLRQIAAAMQDVAPRGAVASLETAMGELTQKVDQARELMARLGEHQLDSAPDFESLEQRLAEIGEALADVAPRASVNGLEHAMRDLSERMDSARSVMERAVERNAGASSAEIEALGAQVAAMGRALTDVAPRGQLAALETAVRDLGERIERSRGEGLRDQVLAPIETIADEVRRAVVETGASANLDHVVRQLQALEDKIEDLRRAGGADRSSFLQACDQSDELRASIAQALDRMAPVERLEKQVAGLTERLEELSQHASQASRAHEDTLAQSAAGWREIGSRLDTLAERIERAAERGGEHGGEPSGAGERRFDELSRRLDFMHQALAERIDGAGAHQTPQDLEPLLRTLAERLDTAMAPHADGRALEALERQMAQVSARLDDVVTTGSFNLERALSDLTARLEQSRAESPAAGVINRDEQAAREIAELREQHENSDRRAKQTLSAVHETLEKVVDRLAMLEEDVLDVRAPRDEAQSFAAAPQPAAAHHTISASQPAPMRAAAVAAPSVSDDFDTDSLLMEPGAGRPSAFADAAMPRASARFDAAADVDGRDHPADDGAPGIKLSRDDEAAMMAKSPAANYIDVARRHLAARAAAEAAEQVDAPKNPVAGAAERAKQGAAKFIRPLAAGDKRTTGRMPVVLAAAGAVMAMGAFELYRYVAAPVAPVIETVATPKAEQSPAPAPAPEAAASAPAQAEAPTAAPSAPVVAPAQPAAKPQHGASLLDPLSVSAIAPRSANMAAIESGAQADSLRAQAERGDAVAQYDYASRLAEGRGLARDPAAAVAWFEKAAAQGQPQAEYRLGVIYEKGLGVARDSARARANYQKAAAQGHVRAMHNLAVIEAEGVDGKPDYASAAQWFRRAADYGVRDSQFNLAILYARGMGVTQNMAQSYVWFAAAAQQGDEDAAKKRDEIAGRLSASDLDAAKKQVAAFQPRLPQAAINEAPAGKGRPQAASKN